MKRNDILLLGALFLLAFALRFYDIAYPDFRWMDEQGHVPAAVNYWTKGQFEPDNWDHPPLRHLMLYGFLKVFGDNPYGWRMRNVLFGAVAAVLTCLFAFSISGSRKIAALAGLLLATDPLHIVLSRYTYEEIYGGAFFLAAIVLFLMHRRRTSWFILSAVFMGCALAIKWYYVPVWVLICSMALGENKNYRDRGSALFVASIYLLVPLSVYLLSYYKWFGRGYSFGEFIEFTVNAYHAQQSYRLENYDQNLIFVSHASAAEWFLKPIMLGRGTYLGPGKGEFIVYMNNLPVWILTVPSIVILSIIAFGRRTIRIGIPAVFFAATYILFLFVKRPVFIYSAVPLLPFAFTAIAYSFSELAGKFRVKAVSVAALSVMLAWNLYLYPFVTAKKVPIAPYRYLLEHSEIIIH